MKAKVVVTLKEGVLDPQGATIKRALSQMSYRGVREVRQGKYFELEFQDASDPDKVRQQAEEIARKVLSNPVIESFRIEEIQ
ncbi:MAG TPA: phosphoribosylformylglycinamidine synthase subunit PurS [Acidobacteriota bacterium]|nr:phosphoribosylformylglycinamidine synthase subunit PurS [Acidobacteriota bacterium]